MRMTRGDGGWGASAALGGEETHTARTPVALQNENCCSAIMFYYFVRDIDIAVRERLEDARPPPFPFVRHPPVTRRGTSHRALARQDLSR